MQRAEGALAAENESAADIARVPDAEAIWLDITAAHRRAALAFTPEFIRAADLASDEG